MQLDETRERRNKSNHMIESMLDERKQLLSLLLRTSSIRKDTLDDGDEELLEEFCQVLVDYIAAGHFGLYGRIAEGRERRADIAVMAKSLYPKIDQSTQQALVFSEKYNTENNERSFDNLSKDLSGLGESLTTRIELEDQLISRLLG